MQVGEVELCVYNLFSLVYARMELEKRMEGQNLSVFLSYNTFSLYNTLTFYTHFNIF